MPIEWRNLTIEIGSWPEHGISWKVLNRIERALVSWEETPYSPGQQCKKVGVDCVRFGCGVLDELYRTTKTSMPVRAQDASLHDRDGALAAMREIMGRYPEHDDVTDGWVEPGDILVTGPTGINGGPGHMMLVGHKQNTAWQATQAGVHFTGLFLPAGYRLFRVYRMCNRELWA